MKNLFLLLVLLYSVEIVANENPLLFIEDKGQVTDQYYQPRQDIDFMLRENGLSLFIGNGRIHYQFKSLEQDFNREPHRHGAKERMLRMHRIDVELLGANLNAQPITALPQEYYEQYFSQLFGDNGALAHSYSKVTYPDIYPNIDWVLYIKENRLEYEFIVKEGGNVKDIRLKYSGADQLKIEADGSLKCVSSLGSIIEKKPYSYTQRGEIASAYNLHNDILTFDIASYSGQLTIDPTVEWVYDCCGGDFQKTSGVTVDNQGDIYITGETYGGNIATTGAYQNTFAGMGDGFVIKLNSSGIKLWGTYFGGPDKENSFDVEYDHVGAIYIYGTTTSTTGIASSGAHQTTYSGPGINDEGVFLAKFSLAGARLWSTYYGNGGMGWGSLACDHSGNAYICGGTSDPIGIASIGSHQESIGGFGDGFLVKFNTDGVRQWGTYYGGEAGEVARGVTTDNNNNVYISGYTFSHTNIATPGAFQTSFSTPDAGMLAKFDSNGVMQWGTYYGRSQINSVASDNNGNVFIGGMTPDTNTISTPGAYQTSYAGGLYYGDAFIAKFDAAGNRQWGTYLGGSDDEYLERIETSPDDFLYITGFTKSTSGVATSNAFQPTYQGGTYDGIFAKFASNGMCMWSSYYGTSGVDACYDIAFEGNYIFYMSGLDPQSAGDGFLVKFQDNSSGVEQINKFNKSVTIYPNPNTGEFALRCDKWHIGDKISIAIIDVVGKIVYKEEYRYEKNISINLTGKLPPGVYLALSTNGGETSRTPFIYK